MSTTQTDRLRGLVEPLAAARSLDLESVEVTTVGRRRRVSVVVDADGGVDLDTVAELSREVSTAIDEAELRGGIAEISGSAYVLEVGSPGVDRPLVEPRHWRRAVGRMVLARLVGGGEVRGRLRAVGADGIVLGVRQPVAKGRPPAPEKDRELSYAEIAKARTEVEFGRGSDRSDDSGDAGAAAGSPTARTDAQKEA